jgi:hypothetical protein
MREKKRKETKEKPKTPEEKAKSSSSSTPMMTWERTKMRHNTTGRCGKRLEYQFWYRTTKARL